MARSMFLVPALVTVIACSILFSGCTGEKGPSQPPASTLTVPPTTPVTPAPVTFTLPVVTTTTMVPPTAPPFTPLVTPGTISQGSRVRITDRVAGYLSARGNFIDEIRFTVALVPKAESVNFEIPTTQIVFTKFGVQFGTNYMITGRAGGDSDSELEEGESFRISVPIQPPYEIYAGQNFIMAIKIPRTDVTVTAQAPAVLQAENILA